MGSINKQTDAAKISIEGPLFGSFWSVPWEFQGDQDKPSLFKVQSRPWRWMGSSSGTAEACRNLQTEQSSNWHGMHFLKIGASRVSSGVSNGVSNGPGSPLVLRQAKKPLPLVLGFPLLCFTCQAAAKGVDDWAKNPIIQPPSPLALMSSSSLQVASVDSILGADCIFMVMISLLSFTQNQVPTWFTPNPKTSFFLGYLALIVNFSRLMIGWLHQRWYSQPYLVIVCRPRSGFLIISSPQDAPNPALWVQNPCSIAPWSSCLFCIVNVAMVWNMVWNMDVSWFNHI